MNKTLEQLQREDDEILRARTTSSYSYSSGMMAELIAECIEDARRVRQTALANAKAALDEAFDKYNQGKI